MKKWYFENSTHVFCFYLAQCETKRNTGKRCVSITSKRRKGECGSYIKIGIFSKNFNYFRFVEGHRVIRVYSNSWPTIKLNLISLSLEIWNFYFEWNISLQNTMIKFSALHFFNSNIGISKFSFLLVFNIYVLSS